MKPGMDDGSGLLWGFTGWTNVPQASPDRADRVTRDQRTTEVV